MELFNTVWNDGTKLRDVTAEVIDSIAAVYQENPPELVYFMALYHIFSAFLDDLPGQPHQ